MVKLFLAMRSTPWFKKNQVDYRKKVTGFCMGSPSLVKLFKVVGANLKWSKIIVQTNPLLG